MTKSKGPKKTAKKKATKKAAKTAEGKAKPKNRAKKSNGDNLNLEETLWAAADRMRGAMDAAEYKHVVLGLIFLKYISDAFDGKHAELKTIDGADPEDRDEYLADNIFWVPKDARWTLLKEKARKPNIGTLVDKAMQAVEKENGALKGVLTKDYARPSLNKEMLGDLIDLISGIGLGDQESRAKDTLGRVYEYFLGKFANAEGKGGGEFYTPRSVVRVLVEMLEPYQGRIYDPCCGSGGMFVESEKFVLAHQGRIGDIAIYGQEMNNTTWRLAKMNMAVRQINADIQWNNEGSFHNDVFKEKKFDYILANPPFNISDWGGDRLTEDVRWKYGTPPESNANYAWLQHIIHHLSPKGTAGVVLANGSMSSNQSGEGEIRRKLIEADLVDCMVALPGQLFYSTQIPACLWFLTRSKRPNGFRDRQGEVLFIDARNLGCLVDRTRRELSTEDIQKISETYHAWRGEAEAIKHRGEYEDVPGFCKAASVDETKDNDFVLTPGRYVGVKSGEIEIIPFQENFSILKNSLEEQFQKGEQLTSDIRETLSKVKES